MSDDEIRSLRIKIEEDLQLLKAQTDNLYQQTAALAAVANTPIPTAIGIKLQ